MQNMHFRLFSPAFSELNFPCCSRFILQDFLLAHSIEMQSNKGLKSQAETMKNSLLSERQAAKMASRERNLNRITFTK